MSTAIERAGEARRHLHDRIDDLEAAVNKLIEAISVDPFDRILLDVAVRQLRKVARTHKSDS